MRRKVLYLCHNHPAIFPGGAEGYAWELYRAMQQLQDEFEPIFVARVGSNAMVQRPAHPGTPWSAGAADPNQYYFHTDVGSFDSFHGTLRDRDALGVHFDEFLRAHRPDIVHVQHSMFIGYDVLRQIRNSLPETPIVYTLHEYLPICHNNGQMVRTRTGELCSESSPRRCHECFPEISQEAFFLRKRFIQSHLALVDRFLAPSQFLLERYVEWGIPRDRIGFEEYGRFLPPVPGESELDQEPQRRPFRLGFFGQINPYKGVTVLLQAMLLLAASEDPCEAHLWVHGANLELQSATFQAEIRRLCAATSVHVTFAGPYAPADVGRLMSAIDWVVVPSVWWENSPLVIQEAFHHHRPVLCGDIGGMAEKVANGKNGLHFRAGDAASLAAVIRRATADPGLWRRLRDGAPTVYTAKEHAAKLTDLYRTLLRSRSGAR